MARLLDQFPKPLLEDLVAGSWLPIVGAGFSRNAVLTSGDLPADWTGLGRAIASTLGPGHEDASPLEAISAYEHSFGRVALVDKVATLIRANDAEPGEAHLAFARIGFTNVLTTNFDFLLERAYERIRKGCLPLVDEAQLSAPNRTSGPRVIKLHGDLHHPTRLIVTEDDYDQFLHRYPLLATSVTATLIDHTGVLIGYSLDDADTRQLLALIKMRLGSQRRPLWTIQFNAKPHIVTRFERRGVKVVNLSKPRSMSVADAYAQLLTELGDHWRSRVSDVSVSSDDRVNADLRLPASESQRLCYFAIPVDLIGWYRENIFPEVEAAGLVPVTAREVFSAPGTTFAKIDSLIDRASYVIAEIGSSPVTYEAILAIGKKGGSNVLLIVDRDALSTNYYSLSELQLIVRPSELEADPEELIDRVRAWLRAVVKSPADRRPEPERLLAEGEYNAALIAAVALLEASLTRRLAGEAPSKVPLRVMVRDAQRMGLIISGREQEDVERALTKRNEIAHGKSNIGPAEARELVRTLVRVIDRVS